MTSLRSLLRQGLHRSGGQRARIAAHRLALRLGSGAFRNEIGMFLHADPADQRGVLLAVYRGNLDRSAVATWRKLVTELRPTVAIDIGANYGEVAFSARYRGLRQLYLVEPNPAVLTWLRRTVDRAAAGYPDSPEVVLHEGAASDRAGYARLNYHEHSGTASLRSPSGRGAQVECFRLDDRIELAPDDSLLFKIDVEGYEQSVLDGMTGLLRGRRVAGICEILHADDSLVEWLCARFAVSIVRRGVEQPTDAPALRDVLAQARTTGWAGLSKDVIVRSG